MKKPVKLTGAALQAVIEKRKHRKITVTKALSSGNLEHVTKLFTDFAEANGIDVADVKYNQSYYGAGYLTVRRLETDEEKAKRVREDEAYKYRNAMYTYNAWEREQAQLRAQAAAIQARIQQPVVKNQQCCPSNCCCRKK